MTKPSVLSPRSELILVHWVVSYDMSPQRRSPLCLCLSPSASFLLLFSSGALRARAHVFPLRAGPNFLQRLLRHRPCGRLRPHCRVPWTVFSCFDSELRSYYLNI
jgi:hypothetical protein